MSEQNLKADSDIQSKVGALMSFADEYAKAMYEEGWNSTCDSKTERNTLEAALLAALTPKPDSVHQVAWVLFDNEGHCRWQPPSYEDPETNKDLSEYMLKNLDENKPGKAPHHFVPLVAYSAQPLNTPNSVHSATAIGSACTEAGWQMLAEDEVLKAIFACGPDCHGRIALTCESGPYDISRTTFVADLLATFIQRAFIEKNAHLLPSKDAA